MVYALPEPKNDGDRKLLADIARVGWAVIGISEKDEGPGYAFSVGLFHTFGHPEIILIGLPWKVSYQFVNDIGVAVKAGKKYENGREYDDLAAGYPAAFVAVDRRFYKKYLGSVRWFYHGWNFPVLQMVWCDRDLCWPWDDGKTREYWQGQPVLGHHAEPGAASDTGRR